MSEGTFTDVVTQRLLFGLIRCFSEIDACQGWERLDNTGNKQTILCCN